jgi:NADH:ubiquinone oxidoreductase subunit C
VITVDVAVADWVSAVTRAKADGRTYFDFLTAVDEGVQGLRLVCHLARPDGGDRIVLQTVIRAAAIDSVARIYAGAAWHERETAEMFGIVFVGHPGLDRLLLAAGFVGNPLRKDFVLAARATRPWPGAEAARGTAELRSGGRRRVAPPGVPGGWEVPGE